MRSTSICTTNARCAIVRRPTAAHRRRPAVAADGMRRRQSAPGRGRAGSVGRDAGAGGFQRGAAGAIVSVGRESGGGEGPRSWTGRSASSIASAGPKRNAAVTEVFSTAPFANAARQQWPSVSVVVCAYNAASTIDDCLTALEGARLPKRRASWSTIGRETDRDARRAHAGVRLIEIANGGLSAARNIGLHAARNEIVTYVDADVRVEPSWLSYLVQPFALETVAAGGPNVVPRDDCWFAQCVARAPGALQIMCSSTIEMRTTCLAATSPFDERHCCAIGGFDPVFLRAGDDVDVCWRCRAAGGMWDSRLQHSCGTTTAPTRLSARTGSQQVGYGEGEAWLRCGTGIDSRARECSGAGGSPAASPSFSPYRVRRLHSGTWGMAAFPTVYQTGASRCRPCRIPPSGRSRRRSSSSSASSLFR